METPQNLKEVFVRYLENRYTAEDFLLIQDHFQQETERETLLNLIAAELESTLAADDTKRIDRILHNTDAHILSELTKRKIIPIPLYRRLPFRIAAAAVIIIGIGLGYFLRQPEQPHWLTVSVPYGKQLQLILPDSSKIWLNAGTTIQYPEKFNGATRPFQLKDGQAFFETVHDVTKPFVITAKGVNVTVLGTSFEVTAFTKENKASVVVSGGKVGVQSPKQRVVFLVAGEKAVINQTSHQVSKEAVNEADIAAWRSQQLIFQNESLLSVFQILERTYNIHFEINNKRIAQERVTTRFKDQTIDNVLMALSFSNHFKYSKTNQTVIVN